MDETDLIGKQLKKIVENEGSQRGGGKSVTSTHEDVRKLRPSPPLRPPNLTLLPQPASSTQNQMCAEKKLSRQPRRLLWTKDFEPQEMNDPIVTLMKPVLWLVRLAKGNRFLMVTSSEGSGNVASRSDQLENMMSYVSRV